MNCEETLYAVSAARLTLITNKSRDTLRVVPPENLTPELVDALKEHKAEIRKIMLWDERRREYLASN